MLSVYLDRRDSMANLTVLLAITCMEVTKTYL